jgi:hypothetical protein
MRDGASFEKREVVVILLLVGLRLLTVDAESKTRID